MNYEKMTAEELISKLNEVSEQKQIASKQMVDLRNSLSLLEKNTELTMKQLKELKDEEDKIIYQIYLNKTENLKEALHLNSLKNILNEFHPFVKKIKNKGKEITLTLSKNVKEQKIDEKIIKYKDDLINKAQTELSKVKTNLKKKKEESEKESSVTQVEIKASYEELLEFPSTKKESIDLWVKFNGISYDENNIDSLYDNYIAFLNSKFNEEETKNITYSKKGSAFKTALKKAFSL